jgi:hypothetical protein
VYAVWVWVVEFGELFGDDFHREVFELEWGCGGGDCGVAAGWERYYNGSDWRRASSGSLGRSIIKLI